MTLTILALLALAAFVAGFVDSIAGGGGLLALPALLLAGLDPVSALATNKLQGSFGTASATYAFWKKGHIDIKANWHSIAATFAAACLGVLAVNYAPKNLLTAALPILLVMIALYFAFSPRLSPSATPARIPLTAFAFGIAPALGFYDGIFGPGTGSFYMMSLVTLMGLGVVQATAKTKLLNFTSNIASLLVFAFSGKIIWIVGLVMGIAQFAGAQLGSRFAMKHGARIIRPLLVIVCVAMAIKLLMDPANPLRAFFP
ncbi:MAG: TSUP family transporter [Alphaproteobacteria bacterium]|nr:TSUP family transporter [Alphaproteobacteria bacterium]